LLVVRRSGNHCASVSVHRITRMGREDVDTLLIELSQCNTATELEDGLWMRAQVQRDASPGRRHKHSSSSSDKRVSSSLADARQHG